MNDAFNKGSFEISLSTGDIPVLLQLGLILALFDLVLAVLVSIYNRRLSSALGYQGLVRKFGFYVVFLFLYALVRWKLHENALVSLVFFNGVLLGVILFELASVKRHLIRLGVPEKFLSWIPQDQRLRDAEERDGNA
jgi:toxin secretion/phage lysis holin